MSSYLHFSFAPRTLQPRRWPSGAVLPAVLGVFLALSPVRAAIPVVWTAGGLDSGSTGAGQAARIATDAFGNVLVVSGPALARSLAVTSYTSTGTLRWRSTVTPVSGTYDGNWVVGAPNGDVIAVGTNVDSSGQPFGLVLARFANDGTLKSRTDLQRTRVAVARLLTDANSNVFLGFSSVGNAQNIEIHKFNTSGGVIWAQGVSTSSGALDVLQSMALSPDGLDLAIAGNIGGNWIVGNFSALAGTRRWLVTAPEGTAARDVVADASRVYVTGQGVTGAGTPSIQYWLTVVAYDRASGTKVWRRDSGPGAGNAVGHRIALAPDGSVVVAGASSGGGYFDWWIVAVESTGVLRWQTARNAALTGDEIPSSVFVQPDGTAVVSGIGGPVVRDILGNSYLQGVIAGYSPAGAQLWEGFARMGVTWAAPLGNGDVCGAGGYDALVTCWHPSGATTPVPPSGLTARLDSSGNMALAWQDTSLNETSAVVERSEIVNGAFSQWWPIAQLAPNATAYNDTTWGVGTTNYRIRATYVGGSIVYSNTATVTMLSSANVFAPNAVMTATPSSGPAPLAVSFSGSGSTDPDNAITSWMWSFGDGSYGAGVAASHTYSTTGTYPVILRVLDATHVFAYATSTITATAAPPPAPTGLTAAAQSRSSIALTWTNGTTNQTEVRIERCRGTGCTNFAQIAAVAGTARTFTDTGLSNRTSYSYRVRAVNSVGVSPYSGVASATTQR